jgi:hypothetical protein
MAELCLNVSDGRVDFGHLRFVPHQRHRQQILIPACLAMRAVSLLKSEQKR